ncbi:MAG TPA: hypothetical protein QGI22_03560 [Candidatus Woesearchaeota archaeon]|jgi:pentatricopeptide repeat protein|nr:hypothetical protein [Candidatus Woesearchaeota archaeon]|tara:strand:- start:23551 stop:24561 length:1011 start_codon:yes stop_codon:yes gene_type:complete
MPLIALIENKLLESEIAFDLMEDNFKTNKTLDDQITCEMASLSLHTYRSVAGAYCVMGEYDQAISTLDLLQKRKEVVSEKIDTVSGERRSILEEELSRVPVSELRVAVKQNQFRLTEFFDSVSKDPEYQRILNYCIKENNLDYDGIDKLIEKHMKIMDINNHDTGLFKVLFNDGLVMGLINEKRMLNDVKPNAVFIGSDNPAYAGADAGFSLVPGIKFTIEAIDAVSIYGSFPEGEYIKTAEHDKGNNPEKIFEYSKNIAQKAAEFAVDNNRNFVEKSDVINSYNLMSNGDKKEAHQIYEAAIKSKHIVEDLVHKSNSLEEFMTYNKDLFRGPNNN